MMDQIRHSDDAELYRQILAVMSIMFRLITLAELTSFFQTLDDLSDDCESLEDIIRDYSSFMTLRGHTLYFVHQSVKDYLLRKAYNEVFPSGIIEVNYTIFSRSLEVMSRTLRRDIYELHAPRLPIDKVKQPDPDPLSAASYSYTY